ncbi:acyl-CoA dehydrogenase family protein [Hyphomonas johnsonii]|uniref:Putative hydrolase NrgC n=1 Tax=Hyphomonas johnsonii MHS-2 TaxID=1280950 RepID=A0A059FPI6_9PROT|nr:acyl-CoA dehydrogenase family protein [Hyphomonas johnsonii]KCZ92393.1 putative hydrolase NrgC [Hyphomonas johnsonii MHS-2]
MADTFQSTDTLANARALAPDLAARAAEMDEVRRLPADLAAKLAKAGMFRMVTPKSLGGLELAPREIVETIEALAVGNASAAWCAMIGATTALNAAYMDPAAASEIYSDPDTITGGVFAPMGKAVVEGDNYRVTGRWQWGSGSANCSWLCGGCTIWEDGEMKRLASGAPDARMMVFPASDATLIDTWHVMGLKGTGSGDIAVNDIIVPKARSVSLVADVPHEKGPLFTFPVFGLLALGISSVALGNARGALDSFAALATAKKSQGSAKTLAERQTIQTDFARCEAAWRAARAYLFDEVDQAWAVATRDGAIPVERRAALRLACSHMTRTGADICRTVYELGGGAALFESSDLQRRFRDAHGITQHIMTAPATWELGGRILFGLPTDASMV